MRVALCHPTYWPEVRRGSERVVHDLATRLSARGHEVTILTTHRARPTTSEEEGVRVVRGWRPPGLPPLRWYEDFVNTIPGLMTRLARGRFDVAQAFHPSSAYAAARARRVGGPPFVLSFHGTPARTYLVGRRYRLEMLQRAIGDAAETTALSSHVAAIFRRYLAVEPTVLPPGVHAADFAAAEQRAPVPTVVCAADLADPRKRGDLLLEGCERLRRTRPELRLELAGGGGARLSSPAWVGEARCDDTPSLARALARSWASVLPSIEEAFGLVVVESLAAGRPVAATRSGALPELLGDVDTGRLFEPDDPADLARALDEVLDLSDVESTSQRCRERAAAYDWDRVLDHYEEMLERVAAAG